MKVSRLNASLLAFLLTFFSITVTARAADDDDEPDDYDVKARVVRISLITGEVNLKRNGNSDWERARLNYPLVEGDTIATDKESRMEIQIDARNFVRLAPGTALRIVTLRDEGIALSVLEGTAVVRLLKFDKDKEYFEVDAPRTTLAAEKPGLYRIDVPRDGRVRLTVRDGGSARIYSDTSGFSLRDGRAAELVVTGDTAGDWEFLAAASDVIDEWVNDRERYLAQQLRYNADYYDEYVWGAEELAAYGDWTYTTDFGWIWRPHPETIRPYADWAPYRYGQWVWCPPYGWTWVGNEPWGWAPYHYGRWVYHNNGWAWAPRDKYNRQRSWWRPALVVFNISFGNDICWYPIPYHQRDPYSRRYRHQDRRPSYPGGAGGSGQAGNYPRPGGGSGGHNYPRRGDGDRDYKTWRGVTRVPRRDFGDDRAPGQPVDEGVARRVLDSAPEVTELPRRTPVAGGATESGNTGAGNSELGNGPRTVAAPRITDVPTGAGERRPGVALDEDLRRSRVFRGREPRTAEPSTQTTSAPAPTTNTAAPTTNAPVGEAPAPSGAVARPEPAPDERPGRIVRPVMPEGGEKRGRGQQRIETRSEPRISDPPRSDPQPSSDPRPSESRPEPRTESPRSESPRRETPRSEPPPRVESPRSEPPRNDPPPRAETPRSDPPPRNDPPPRTESPRSEPRESPKKPDNRR